jgi:subtilisin-like proprotein convertase family protein
LISPSDTVSEILSYRKNDRSNKGVNYFPFMTLFNWGESPIGQWKLIIETRTRNDTTEKYTGSLDYLSLVFYGSKKSQEPKKRFVDQLQQKAYIPTAQEVVKMYDTEIKVAREARIIDKRVFEENSELRNLLKNSVIEE